MSDPSPFGGVSLLDLFKLEAESHGAALSDGLLAWEKAPTAEGLLEPLMRAAHSIKGAARIVGLDGIVSLAHAMEECFLAAREGRESLTPPRVDQLLKCVDLLGEVRTVAEADLPAWIGARADAISGLVAQLKVPAPAGAAATIGVAPSSHSANVTQTPVASPARVEAPREALSVQAPGAVTGHVRVAAEAMNRMLFLAGESTVEASRLQSLRGLLAALKTRARLLDEAVQLVGEALRRRAPAAETTPDASYGALVTATDALHSELAAQTARLDESLRRVEDLSGALHSEVVRSRLRPFVEGIGGFPRMVRDIARELGKDVALVVEGESVHVDRDILQKLESPLTHLIRNSLDHGVEPPDERERNGKPRTATITLRARHQGGMLVIEVRDDGRGIDPDEVRRKVVERRLVDDATAARLSRAELMEMLFLPGFSTRHAVTEMSGRGVGLDVVQSMAQTVAGTVVLESEHRRGAKFTLRLPVTRSVVRAVIVRVGGELFAVPLARLDRIVVVAEADARPVQGRAQINLEGSSVGLVWATDVLNAGTPAGTDSLAVLVVGVGSDRCGMVVDEICAEEDLVVRPLDPRLGMVPHVSAAAIRSDGVPVLVIDVDDVWRSVREALQGGRPLGQAPSRATRREDGRRRILVVDDSITVREVERQLLMRHGYDVSVAVDGKDGFNMLRSGSFDLLVTDVDMPRMTGIELVRAVRREPRLAELPIIIVSYKDRESDRVAGLEAGASAYLTKSSFQDDSLVRMVSDLIGAPRLMRIALVNDLELALECLRRAVATIPGATVAWIAKDGAEAVAKCAADVPDVILMDMIMPVMDGVEATRRIMRTSPCPIIVVTATVEGNAGRVFEALGAGALDALATPGLSRDGGVINAEPLVRKVQAIALLNGFGASAAPRSTLAPPVRHARGIPALVAIGASTGGPQALATVLCSLPHPAPWPIIVVQHIDAMFASGLSEWLARATGHRVSAAVAGDLPTPNRVLLACSDDHLIVDSSGRVQYTQEPREMVYRPSVDVCFESLVQAGVRPGVAVLLTGMGRDGAAGMASLRAAGWTTLAQDEASSVVWGMPGAAVQIGAAARTLPIEAIGGAIVAGMLDTRHHDPV